MLEQLGARGAGGRWRPCEAGDLALTWPLGLCRTPGELDLLLGAGRGGSHSLLHVTCRGCCLIPPPAHPRGAVVAEWVILTGVTSQQEGLVSVLKNLAQCSPSPLSPLNMLLVHLNINPVLTLTSPRPHPRVALNSALAALEICVHHTGWGKGARVSY